VKQVGVRDLFRANIHTLFLLGYFSTLKMKGTCSSEILVDFQQTTLRYSSENGTLQLVEHHEISDKHTLTEFPI
jgi:hypothetical protein